MSGYTDSQGRFRKIAGGRTAKVHFPECEVCGYLGAPHIPDICERNQKWDEQRKAKEAASKAGSTHE